MSAPGGPGLEALGRSIVRNSSKREGGWERSSAKEVGDGQEVESVFKRRVEGLRVEEGEWGRGEAP